MAKNSWDLWISGVQYNDIHIWNQYDGFKTRDNNRHIPAEYKHKSNTSQPNRILYLDVFHDTIKVTTHVLYHILSNHGEIQRIVTYRKFNKRKALVEFAREEDAKKVISKSNVIIRDGFSLKIEYAKVSSLSVQKNDERTWDYTKEPIMQYENGLHMLKSSSSKCVSAVHEDSSHELKSVVVMIKQCWEIVEDFNLVEKIKIREKSSTDKSYNHWSEVNNGKTHTKQPEFRESDQLSVLSVKGIDPAKSNCDRLFRLLSMYASITRIHFSRELNYADVEIGKCDKIDTLAQVQLHTLSHGKNLSFQYLPHEWSVVYRTIDRFVLPDKSPSYVHYDRRIQTDLSPCPSKIVRFYGAPPDITHDELVSLLKPKLSVQNFDVKIMTKGTKRNVAYGEIKFETVSEAIEAVMSINYVVFRCKNNINKKKYVLNLVFAP